MISNVLCRPCRLGLKISDVITTEPGLSSAMARPWQLHGHRLIRVKFRSQRCQVANKRKQARRRWMKMLFRQLNLAVGLRRWAQNIPKPSEHRAAQWVQNFARWRRRKSKAKEVTTSPWLGKALLENVTSRRILGTSLLDKEILKDYMFRSNPPDGTSLQYLDGILISVWFAFINRVVTLQILVSLLWKWPHDLFEALSQLRLRFMPGVKYNHASARKRVETWSLFSFRPAPEENQRQLPRSSNFTQVHTTDPGTQDSAYPFPWPYPVRT